MGPEQSQIINSHLFYFAVFEYSYLLLSMLWYVQRQLLSNALEDCSPAWLHLAKVHLVQHSPSSHFWQLSSRPWKVSTTDLFPHHLFLRTHANQPAFYSMLLVSSTDLALGTYIPLPTSFPASFQRVHLEDHFPWCNTKWLSKPEAKEDTIPNLWQLLWERNLTISTACDVRAATLKPFQWHL